VWVTGSQKVVNAGAHAPFGHGTCLIHRNTPFPSCVTIPNLVALGHAGTSGCYTFAENLAYLVLTKNNKLYGQDVFSLLISCHNLASLSVCLQSCLVCRYNDGNYKHNRNGSWIHWACDRRCSNRQKRMRPASVLITYLVNFCKLLILLYGANRHKTLACDALSKFSRPYFSDRNRLNTVRTENIKFLISVNFVCAIYVEKQNTVYRV